MHYGFVVWLQYALLGAALFAVIKGAIVFGATLILSWITIVAVQRIPFGARLIGATPHAIAASASGPAVFRGPFCAAAAIRFAVAARSFQRLPRGLADDGKAFIHITRDVRV